MGPIILTQRTRPAPPPKCHTVLIFAGLAGGEAELYVLLSKACAPMAPPPAE